MNQINSVIPDTDFGRYLASVTERDIDLLLLEEFHVNNDFVAWFCGKIDLHNVTAAGAWHSLSDTDGESDLVLRGAAPVKTGHEERLNFEVVLRLCLSPALTWNPLKF
ncbi:hypothetical protein [Paraburkholderia dioscoreae]|uniref:Uncharacterized protein n=1 Tax=Paraburkholderia dioscoreae TaxID=2604047 RepID=A0A5Q4YVE3_9BURK|nr:hypothetical protein [Paraburkholderia dioscoreae]VVD31725.1 protein of unknown function [Paraburkholderia dioscoreae]